MAARGLGRGFDSLIPTDVLDETFDPTAGSDEKVSELRFVAVEAIVPNPDQPRRDFDRAALEELAESLKHHGVIQPIIVAAKGDKYQIVAGERRWRAAQIAGLDKVPALVRTLSNQHKLEVALIENLQRENLNALETATAYLKLNTQFNMTHEEIAKRAGGKVTVYNSEHPSGFNPYDGVSVYPSLVTGQVDKTVVPDGQIFVIGDNRGGNESLDSRNGLGLIPLNNIVGPVVMRIYPFTKISTNF